MADIAAWVRACDKRGLREEFGGAFRRRWFRLVLMVAVVIDLLLGSWFRLGVFWTGRVEATGLKALVWRVRGAE
jgi:hypothetical protein